MKVYLVYQTYNDVEGEFTDIFHACATEELAKKRIAEIHEARLKLLEEAKELEKKKGTEGWGDAFSEFVMQNSQLFGTINWIEVKLDSDFTYGIMEYEVEEQ